MSVSNNDFSQFREVEANHLATVLVALAPIRNQQMMSVTVLQKRMAPNPGTYPMSYLTPQML